ncbi:MAG: response regulator transcription factor [Oscillospiraceae bacterium]|nr:response regulator transcription factor [Oscillospiraceae bacterium]
MIWCVEDDASIRDIEVYALQSAGMEARGFEDGDSFLSALKNELPDLVILDVMLPGKDGIELLQNMKTTKKYADIPVIMATAKGAEFDKVQGLDLGADDYLVKPFGMMEMISRVKAVMRRCNPKGESRVVSAGEIMLNLDERTVTVSGKRISLTYKEFELLALFMKNLGRVFSRDTLYNEIWGSDFVGETRTVDVHIRTLRQKLGDHGDMIETVRNVGYRMEVKNDK